MAKKQQPKTKLTPKNMIVVGVILIATIVTGAFVYNKVSSSNAAFISGYGCTYAQTLRQGSSGNCVRYAQAILNQWNSCYLRSPKTPLVVDGSFGSLTRARVISFQTNRGLAADGVIGPNTWNSLMSTRCGTK